MFGINLLCSAIVGSMIMNGSSMGALVGAGIYLTCSVIAVFMD